VVEVVDDVEVTGGSQSVSTMMVPAVFCQKFGSPEIDP